MQRTEIIEALQKARNRLSADLLEFVEACPYSLEMGWIEEGEVFTCYFPLSRTINPRNYINNLIKVAEFIFKVKTGSRSCLSYPGITMPVKKHYELYGTEIKEFSSMAEEYDYIQSKGTLKYCELMVEVISKRLSSKEQQKKAVIEMLAIMAGQYPPLRLRSILHNATRDETQVTLPLHEVLAFIDRREKGLEPAEDVNEEEEDKESILEEMEWFAYDPLEQMKATKIDRKTLIEYYRIKFSEENAEVSVRMLAEMEKLRQLLLDYNYIKEDLTPCVPLEEIREYLLTLKEEGRCQHCGKLFPYRANKQYCSSSCRRMAYYYRNKG